GAKDLVMGNRLVQISTPGKTQTSESLTPAATAAPEFFPAQTSGTGGAGKTCYIETFGCQMNVHDSEKVAGVLMARGYRPVENHEDADLVFYHTCSIREKAAQKVFSRLGAFKKQYHSSRKIIGVLGCVAQQEGERFFERAPHVNLVCGSASYSRLSDLLAQIEAGKRRVTGLSLDTDERSEEHTSELQSRFELVCRLL